MMDEKYEMEENKWKKKKPNRSTLLHNLMTGINTAKAYIT